jgi:hypothetical protein
VTIDGVLRQQAGVISRAQALAEGMSSATISRPRPISSTITSG